MPRQPQDVTDAELSILQALWDRGPATVRQLTETLYPEATAGQYATVQKLLDRLEAKDCVTRDRGQWPFLFQAAVSRDEIIDRQLRTVAGKLCGGSLTPLLTHLLRADTLTPKERQSLREFMEELGL
jgi:predicted transcriptional regulator